MLNDKDKIYKYNTVQDDLKEIYEYEAKFDSKRRKSMVTTIDVKNQLIYICSENGKLHEIDIKSRKGKIASKQIPPLHVIHIFFGVFQM